MPEFDPDKHYYGKPCKHGHESGMRYRKGGACVTCTFIRNNSEERRAQNREWAAQNKERKNANTRRNNRENPERNRERARRYRHRHLESLRAKDRANSGVWEAANPEAARRIKRAWAERNPESADASKKLWNANNPDNRRKNAANRRANKANATPKWADQEEIGYVYGLATEKGLSVDHIVPLVSSLVCGLHCADNLRCIPQSLNRYKSNRYWPDMPD